MPIIHEYVNARCYQSCYQACLAHLPGWMSYYASTNLDSLPKLLNHVLVVMGFCNICLVFFAWRITFIGWFASILLTSQTVGVYLILNHAQLNVLPRSFAPTDFMVGICLGISIGGTVLAFFLSSTFRRAIFDCYSYQDIMYAHSCENRNTSIRSFWWWGSLCMWFNIASSILIAAGRREFSFLEQHQYETIGPSFDDYDDHNQIGTNHIYHGEDP